MQAAAKMANVHEFVMKTPHHYDTQCSEHGAQLSGGGKQRIAIARALIQKKYFCSMRRPVLSIIIASV